MAGLSGFWAGCESTRWHRETHSQPTNTAQRRREREIQRRKLKGEVRVLREPRNSMTVSELNSEEERENDEVCRKRMKGGRHNKELSVN